jgi:hypothetical protein
LPSCSLFLKNDIFVCLRQQYREFIVTSPCIYVL